METIVQKLTREVIDNCLEMESAMTVGRIGTERFDGKGWAEIQSFRSRLVSSEKLRAGIASAVTAIFDEQSEGCANATNVADLLHSQRVTFKDLQLIEDVCCQFFFLGWQARGAVEKMDSGETEPD